VRTRPIAATLAAVLLAGCGSDPEDRAPSGWLDVAGMRCADGSPTGVAILPGSADAVLVYLAGGRACWSGTACSASPGPFGRAEFEFLQLFAGGTIFDRTLAGNPFANWTIVFVPYCTGDVHLGDRVTDHGGTAGSWQHRGYANLRAAVARIADDLPRPSQVVVAGSSAGGFGALVAHDLLRERWDAGGPDPVTASVVDDSGPTFVGPAISEDLRSAWWEAWNLGSTLGTHCPGCRDDLSDIWRELRERHRDDRLALVSTTEDLTMRRFLDDPSIPPAELSVAEFADALGELTTTIEGHGAAAVFRVASDEHALLISQPWSFSAGGTTLLDWLSALTAGDPAWASAGP
jgi:hypothetical protein